MGTTIVTPTIIPSIIRERETGPQGVQGPAGPAGSGVTDGEVRMTPKSSSTGPEGTMFYCSDDDHVWVATEV